MDCEAIRFQSWGPQSGPRPVCKPRCFGKGTAATTTTFTTLSTARPWKNQAFPGCAGPDSGSPWARFWEGVPGPGANLRIYSFQCAAKPSGSRTGARNRGRGPVCKPRCFGHGTAAATTTATTISTARPGNIQAFPGFGGPIPAPLGPDFGRGPGPGGGQHPEFIISSESRSQ